MNNKGIEYEHLNKFVGKWNTKGRILPPDNSPDIEITGTDTYEWLPGEFFLLHKVDVLMGNDKNETYEIIGFDKTNKQYTMQHYDNKGNSGLMTSTFHDGIWTHVGETLRFKGRFNANEDVFSGIWDQTTDGVNWTQFVEIELTKIK